MGLGRIGEAEAEGVDVGLVEVIHPLIDEVHEVGPLHGSLVVGAVALDEEFLVDVDVGGGVPEVAPSWRENGGSDGVFEGEEGDDYEEESVGEEGEVVGILHFWLGWEMIGCCLWFYRWFFESSGCIGSY